MLIRTNMVLGCVSMIVIFIISLLPRMLLIVGIDVSQQKKSCRDVASILCDFYSK